MAMGNIATGCNEHARLIVVALVALKFGKNSKSAI